nr:portal protein [Xylella fastidiosa]
MLGEDGGEKWKQLYQEVQDPMTGRRVVLNDIGKGKYDVTVTVGPSYATQRMEAAEAMMQLAAQVSGAAPQIAAVLAYAGVQNMDLPGMDEVLAAFRKLLVSQGVLPPKEGDKPPEPPQPNPMQLAQLKKVTADAGLSEARAQHQQAEATQQQLRNAVTAQAVGAPMPDPGGMPQQQQQQQTPPPPQGGFLLPTSPPT